jgi:hypothetical protein
MVIGWVSDSSARACVSGRSIGTPTVSMGAAIMKMIKSTSITSTKGVTLISDMSAWRRPRLRWPPRAACPTDIPMACSSRRRRLQAAP